MVAARSAAMAFNRLVDEVFDAANPRTASRHLPAGILSRPKVWIFFAACCVAFMASTLLFLPNWLPLVFCVPVLLWICGYSYAKRFTKYAHLWLGVALALSPVCAWIGVRGEVLVDQPSDILPAAILGLAVALWVTGFDIIYACQDAQFDRSADLHSMPSKLGIAKALRLSAACHFLMWLVLGSIPLAAPQIGLGGIYFGGLVLVGWLLARQHWIVSPTDLSRVGEAFFSLNALISFGLTTVAALDVFL